MYPHRRNYFFFFWFCHCSKILKQKGSYCPVTDPYYVSADPDPVEGKDKDPTDPDIKYCYHLVI